MIQNIYNFQETIVFFFILCKHFFLYIFFWNKLLISHYSKIIQTVIGKCKFPEIKTSAYNRDYISDKEAVSDVICNYI